MSAAMVAWRSPVCTASAKNASSSTISTRMIVPSHSPLSGSIMPCTACDEPMRISIRADHRLCAGLGDRAGNPRATTTRTGAEEMRTEIRRVRRRRWLAAAAATGLLTPTVACGDNGDSDSDAAENEAASFKEYQLEFAECMRDQGVDFPDPESDDGST